MIKNIFFSKKKYLSLLLESKNHNKDYSVVKKKRCLTASLF